MSSGKLQTLAPSVSGVLLSVALLLSPANPLFAIADKVGPKYRVSATDGDMGTLIQGDHWQHVFTIYNDGDQPLKLTKVFANCSCLSESHDKVIAPGGEGKITVTVDTGRIMGGIFKAVIVQTNDPKNPRNQLFITGTVRGLFKAVPQSILLKAYPGEALQTEVLLRSATELDCEIQSIQARNPNVKVKLSTVTPGKMYKIHVSTPPREKPGQSGEILDLVVRTSDGQVRKLKFTATIVVQRRWSCTPVMLMFAGPQIAKVKNGESAELTAELKSTTKNYKFSIASIRVDQAIAGVQHKIRTITEGSHYQLVLSLIKLGDKKVESGKLTLITDSGEEQTILIRVYNR